VGQLSLAHALSSTLAPPGYNSSRPHCFVLTLAEGGSYFFEAGTPDLVSEWVSTCNYWSARYSKQPLSGGVSNMEYGWNLVNAPDSNDPTPPLGNTNRKSSKDDDMEAISSIRSGKSAQSSARSQLSLHSKFNYRGFVSNSFSPASNGSQLRAGLNGGLGDKLHISDWKAPNVPTGESTLSEEAQLDALKRHCALAKVELARHDILRSSMLQIVSTSSIQSRRCED
jgi:PH/SEC7 domain-containing protein